MDPTKHKSLAQLATAMIVIALFMTGAHADSAPQNPSALYPEPWEKFSVTLGAFISKTQSTVRVGSGLGMDIDVEEMLGLQDNTTVFRAETFWRFSDNRKHRIDASWFAYRRSATRTVGEDFDIKDQDGNTVTIQAGTDVSSHFDLDIIETAYSYSFLQDDRLDLAAVGGIYVMPISFGLQATGLTNTSGSVNLTAPLPVLGLRMDVALTKRWFLRTGSQFFYVEYQNFTGQLTQLHAALEFMPFKHIGVGLGVDSLNMGLEGRDEDYPGVDLKGSVGFKYTGAQLYGKLRF